MNHKTFPQHGVIIVLILLFIVGCSSPATPTLILPTATSIPPTATRNVILTATYTLVPPTATATVVPTATNTSVPPTATLDPAMGRIQGRVFRSDINLPITNITITLYDSSGLETGTTTDLEGKYLYTQVKPGKHFLFVDLIKIDPYAPVIMENADQNEAPGKAFPVWPLSNPALETCKTVRLTCDKCFAVLGESPSGDEVLVSVRFPGIIDKVFDVTAGQILIIDLNIDCQD